MDKLDLEILFDAYDDYDECYNQVKNISASLGIGPQESVRELNFRLERLRKTTSIELFSSDTVYGKMRSISFRELSLEDLQNVDGSLAGPPYYYLHCEIDMGTEQLIRRLDGEFGPLIRGIS